MGRPRPTPPPRLPRTDPADVTSRRSSWHRGEVTSRLRAARNTRGPRTRPAARAALAVAVLAAGALAGCGSGSPGEVVVTVTAGASGSPSGSGSASPSTSTTAPTPDATVASDDTGRKFDFGVVKSVDTVGGTQVLVFDRWTDPKTKDSVLAQRGIEVKTYDLKKIPYENVNTKVTFRVPVREGTSFLLHHCVQKGEPVTSKSVSAEELARAAAADRLILLTIDPKDGYTTGGETFAGC